jgi:hypothetical protein
LAERDPRGSPSADEILAQILALKLELRRVRLKLSGADPFGPAELAAELRAISEAFAEFAEAVQATETEVRPRPADSWNNA